MGKNDEDAKIAQHPHKQMLKLVAKGFYNELIKYGVEEPEILTVAGHLLDNVALKTNPNRIPLDTYRDLLSIKEVNNAWANSKALSIGDVSLSPLDANELPQIASWVARPEARKFFYPPFPDTETELAEYFHAPTRDYFRICHQEDFVGIIGADQIDPISEKLEMRKLIGDAQMRGKGIGKRATFLFLYHSFLVRKYKKVFMHSLDINIRNLNLNGKFGFYLEGVFFEDVRIDNAQHDLVRMALTQSVWQELFS